MTSELIIFNHLRCHSSSTALGTRTGNESQLGEVQMKPPFLTYLHTYSATSTVAFMYSTLDVHLSTHVFSSGNSLSLSG